MADLQALRELCEWANGDGRASLQGLSQSGVTFVRVGELELHLSPSSPLVVAPTTPADDDEEDPIDTLLWSSGADPEPLRRSA